jgi:ribose transport system ATP-binding protein
VTAGETLLEVSELADGGLLHEVSLSVRAGEVVALAGLMGSGRTETLRCIAGLSTPVRGRIAVAGAELPRGSAGAANAAGIAYVPEDRHREGFVPAMSIRDNIALAWLRRNGSFGMVPASATAALAQRLVDALGVRPALPSREVRTLSGGNQQKVVLAKWLATEPRVLLLDEPTRGVDVGAKAEIHRLISGMKEQGLAVLMVSSELPEVLGVADRIVVMDEGRAVGELPRGASEQDVMELAFGLRRPVDGDQRVVVNNDKGSES